MIAAVEVLLNTPRMSELIYKGQVSEIKELIANSGSQGMQTFDQALFDLYEQQVITYDDALRNADAMNDLRLRIKLHSKLPQPEQLAKDHSELSMKSFDDENAENLS